jgi:hypothetical protein
VSWARPVHTQRSRRKTRESNKPRKIAGVATVRGWPNEDQTFLALRAYGGERKMAKVIAIILPIHKKESTMKTSLAITCAAFGALLGSIVVANAEEPTYASQTETFVKDSAITTMIKTKLV